MLQLLISYLYQLTKEVISLKTFKKVLLTVTLSVSMLVLPLQADAASYKVQTGDSFWGIANEYGVPLPLLQKSNNRTDSLLYPGETLVVPDSTVSQAEKELLAKLVHAEAKGESYAGKVAVATVVLNRVDHQEFPDTIKDVIYERSGGHYAFSPVENGAINETPDAEAEKAVNEALAFRGMGQGSIYFYNPETATSDWIRTREVTVTIGNHVFAK